MKKITQAVLLAAGNSSRFYPYNNLGHKSLLVLGGKPLILRTLEVLKKQGVQEFVIVESDARSVSKLLKTYDTKKFNIKYAVQKKPLGMGDALLSASKFLAESFFTLNAYHFEAGEYIKDLSGSIKTDSDIAVLVRKGDKNVDFGVVERTKGKIKIVEKSSSKSSENGIRIIGVYVLNKQFCEILKETSLHEYNFEDAISEYSNIHTLVTVEIQKKTITLKYPWSILSAKDFVLSELKSKISSAAKISSSAEISGNVVIESGVEIMEGAVIKGPVYIGKNAYIGNNAVIRNGVCIEEGAVVGANMEIKNSVIMKHATTHSGFIGDSIIGAYSKIAAQFTTGNVRLDRGEIIATVKGRKTATGMKSLGVLMGSSASVGIKVGTMPGIIIGNDTIIGPGTTVMENIPDSTTYYTEFKKVVKK